MAAFLVAWLASALIQYTIICHKANITMTSDQAHEDTASKVDSDKTDLALQAFWWRPNPPAPPIPFYSLPAKLSGTRDHPYCIPRLLFDSHCSRPTRHSLQFRIQVV